MIKEIVEGKKIHEVAETLALDGFTGSLGTVQEIIDLVEAGKVAEAAQVAHLDGWL